MRDFMRSSNILARESIEDCVNRQASCVTCPETPPARQAQLVWWNTFVMRLSARGRKARERNGRWLAGKVPAFRVIVLNANVCLQAETVGTRLRKPPAASPTHNALFGVSLRPLIPIRPIPRRPRDLHWSFHSSRQHGHCCHAAHSPGPSWRGEPPHPLSRC